MDRGSPSSNSAAVTLASFTRAMEAVRGRKVPGAVKRTSALARLRGSSIKRAWLELAVDGGGYCAIKVFKTLDDISTTGELRFVGPSIQGGLAIPSLQLTGLRKLPLFTNCHRTLLPTRKPRSLSASLALIFEEKTAA